MAGDASFVEASLAASHRVQLEDVALCESVQRGLASSGYDAGRCAWGKSKFATMTKKRAMSVCWCAVCSDLGGMMQTQRLRASLAAAL